MIYEVIYYSTDEINFEEIFCDTADTQAKHGFELEITNDNVPLLQTLRGFGDFQLSMLTIKTYEGFSRWLDYSKELVNESEHPETLQFIDELKHLADTYSYSAKRIAA